MVAAKFPTAVLAQADVGGPMSGIPLNEWTANGATTAGAATPFSLVVNEAVDASVPASGYLTTKNGEVLHYSAVNAGTKTFTVDARAQQGTTAAAIDNASAVGQWLTRDQWNQVVADLIAVETALGTGGTIASAATTDLATTTAQYVSVTGTTTITAFGTMPAGTLRILKFAGALTLTHNATSLIMRSGANAATSAGDVFAFVSEGSGNWREVWHNLPVVGSAVIAWAMGSITTGAASTAYAALSNSAAVNTSEAPHLAPMPKAGTVRNMYLVTGGAQPATGELVLTARKNSVDTVLTLTVPANAVAGTFSDTVNSFAVAPGDLLSFKLVNGASAASATLIGMAVEIA